ncbi:MAG: hypothetical protein BVN32_09490, partial [Proteobacteria bacterium ST_bin14]
MTLSAPVVVTGPTLVAAALFTRSMLPVVPVTEARTLPALVSVYAPPLPFSTRPAVVNAALCVPAPVVVRVSVLPLVVTPAFSAMPPVPAVSDVTVA